MNRQRVTVTLDAELVEAGTAAVQEGRSASLSAWVNEAVAHQVEQERRLEALADAIADYEREFGEIDDAEITAQLRADRDAAALARADRSTSVA